MASSEKRSLAPGPALHSVNELLHKEPISFLFYGLYWSIVLIFLSPLAGVGLIFVTLCRLVFYLTGHLQRSVDPLKDNRQLAVIITGCDSGFGCDLVRALSQKGYVVFAGCLNEESVKVFQDCPRTIPLKMDVTKNEEVLAAAEEVRKWINLGQGQSKRYLHAVVNNAGIGDGGFVDWLDLPVFQRNMDVNYYGLIRTTKAFLPTLKRQAADGDYKSSRVINMVSMAGLVAGSVASPYHGSKFAAEALSACLRNEMKSFGIQVVTVNPSYHESPLTASMESIFTRTWRELPPSMRDEYGEEFFEEVLRNGTEMPERTLWRAKVVVQEMTAAVERLYPPPQVVVGSDAKYVLLLIRHLPSWLQELSMNLLAPVTSPKMMAKKER